MNKTIILILTIAFANSSFSDVSNKDLIDIRKLIEEGQYQQALEKHIWFHEESRTSRGMGGVRLSYAVPQWVYLGEKYFPAMEALVNTRDKEKSILLSGKGSFENFHAKI